VSKKLFSKSDYSRLCKFYYKNLTGSTAMALMDTVDSLNMLADVVSLQDMKVLNGKKHRKVFLKLGVLVKLEKNFNKRFKLDKKKKKSHFVRLDKEGRKRVKGRGRSQLD
jgi:hypothetical protein